MSGLYERMARTRAGAIALAAARLRRNANSALQRALRESGRTRTDLAQELGIRKSAVTQVFNANEENEYGNLRLNTLAEYLYVLGYEVELVLVNKGQPREDAVRDMRQTWRRKPDVADSAVKNLEDLDWNEADETVESVSTAKALGDERLQGQLEG